MTSTRLLGWYLIASFAICGALASCANTTLPALTAEQNLNIPINKKFSSFSEASEILKKLLNEHGYDTSEGDHAIGNAESYLASPLNDNGAEIRVNTSWDKKQPVGSYTVLDDALGLSSILYIARLDAKGVWIDCEGFEFELLSTNAKNTIPQLLDSIRNQLGC